MKKIVARNERAKYTEPQVAQQRYKVEEKHMALKERKQTWRINMLEQVQFKAYKECSYSIETIDVS